MKHLIPLAFFFFLLSCNTEPLSSLDIDLSDPPSDEQADDNAPPHELGCTVEILGSMEKVEETSFEEVEKVNDNNLSWDFPHWFEFAAMHRADGGLGDGLGGAQMWVDTTLAHSGKKSIGMEVFDIEKSRRAEFVLFPSEVISKEYCVSYWLYLPEDWGLYDPSIDWDWFGLGNPYSAAGPPYATIFIGSPDENQEFFSVWLGGRNKDGRMFGTPAKKIAVPKGRWFPISYYVRRDTMDGKVKLWFDGELIAERSGFPTLDPDNPEFTISIAKIYYERGDKRPHKMWIDDLTIHSSQEKN